LPSSSARCRWWVSPAWTPKLRTDAAALFFAISQYRQRHRHHHDVGDPRQKRASPSLAIRRTGHALQPRLQSGAAGLFYGPSTPFGIQGVEAQVRLPALVAAYANDFMLMFWVCLPMLPLLFFMKKPQTKNAQAGRIGDGIGTYRRVCRPRIDVELPTRRVPRLGRSTMKDICRAVLAAAGIILARRGLWSAHIALSQPSFEAGQNYAAFFKVEQGCDGSPTIALNVQIPDGVIVLDTPAQARLDGERQARQGAGDRRDMARETRREGCRSVRSLREASGKPGTLYFRFSSNARKAKYAGAIFRRRERRRAKLPIPQRFCS